MDMNDYARGVALDEIKRLRFLRRCLMWEILLAIVIFTAMIIRESIGNGEWSDICVYLAGLFLLGSAVFCWPKTSVKKYIQHLKDIGGIEEKKDDQTETIK